MGNDKNKKKKFVFEDAKLLEEGAVMTYLNGEQIVSMWENEDLVYIPEIQRGVVKVEVGDGEYEEQPVYSKSNVKQMKESMLRNNFFVSQLTFNVLNESAKFTYDNEKRTLTIEGDILAISDGQHRTRTMKEIKDEWEYLKEEYPNFKLSSLVFPVKISHYNEEKAQEQFYQYTLGNKISTSRKEYFNNKNYANRIVKALYNDSALSGKIENISNTISKKEKIKVVTFATLKSALELTFNTNSIADKDEADEIIVFLKRYFEKLFEVISEFRDYELRVALREANSLKCENITFYGYLSVAHELFIHQKDWEQNMSLLNVLNYEKDIRVWGNVLSEVTVQRKSKNHEQEKKCTITNNTQSRRAMVDKLLKQFKKAKKQVAEETNEVVL